MRSLALSRPSRSARKLSFAPRAVTPGTAQSSAAGSRRAAPPARKKGTK